MEYKKVMHTVVETPAYLRRAGVVLDAEGMNEAVRAVAADPEIGEVMQGTGGFRKFRIARPGMGKRGGARVVYIYRSEDLPVFLITVFAKSEKENLSKAERNALKARADEIFDSYGAKR